MAAATEEPLHTASTEDLAAYEQQQAEVAAMLLEDPDNEELQAIYNDLAEVWPPWHQLMTAIGII